MDCHGEGHQPRFTTEQHGSILQALEEMASSHDDLEVIAAGFLELCSFVGKEFVHEFNFKF